MPLPRHLCQIFVCAALATSHAAAHTDHASHELPSLPAPTLPEMTLQESPNYFDQLISLPLLRFFSPSYLTTPNLPVEDTLDLAVTTEPLCSVTALVDVEDAEALAFENRTHALGAVDYDGLTPSTALALARFQRMVTSAGGFIEVTSAYRPATYQQHLQDVWDKWMTELRFNSEDGCQLLRAAVYGEFQKHALLESQRPVTFSDHTRGISFDAAVRLPRRATSKRRVSVDALARRAGILRPAIARDPVHFRLM